MSLYAPGIGVITGSDPVTVDILNFTGSVNLSQSDDTMIVMISGGLQAGNGSGVRYATFPTDDGWIQNITATFTDATSSLWSTYQGTPPFWSGQTWWRTSAEQWKVREEVNMSGGNIFPTVQRFKYYDLDHGDVAMFHDTITYSSNVFESTRLRYWDGYQNPQIAAVMPVTGITGGTVILSGANFMPGLQVTVVGSPTTPVTVISASHNAITCSMPWHDIGNVQIVVTNINGRSGSGDFYYRLSSTLLTVLAVGGGGGGGGGESNPYDPAGGGGGGGGVALSESYVLMLPTIPYTVSVTIGSGGLGGAQGVYGTPNTAQPGGNGLDSAFAYITASGGGGGGSSTSAGKDGGCGGGGANNRAGGTGTQGGNGGNANFAWAFGYGPGGGGGGTPGPGGKGYSNNPAWGAGWAVLQIPNVTPWEGEFFFLSPGGGGGGMEVSPGSFIAGASYGAGFPAIPVPGGDGGNAQNNGKTGAVSDGLRYWNGTFGTSGTNLGGGGGGGGGGGANGTTTHGNGGPGGRGAVVIAYSGSQNNLIVTGGTVFTGSGPQWSGWKYHYFGANDTITFDLP